MIVTPYLQSSAYHWTRSIIPLIFISGNRHPKQSLISCFSLCDVEHATSGRIEHASQSRTRSRSRSIHSRKIRSPMTPLTSAPESIKWQGTRIAICRRSRCLGGIFWSSMVTHSTCHELTRNVTTPSLVAFERSIEVDPGPGLTGNRSK